MRCREFAAAAGRMNRRTLTTFISIYAHTLTNCPAQEYEFSKWLCVVGRTKMSNSKHCSGCAHANCVAADACVEMEMVSVRLSWLVARKYLVLMFCLGLMHIHDAVTITFILWNHFLVAFFFGSMTSICPCERRKFSAKIEKMNVIRSMVTVAVRPQNPNDQTSV